MKKLFAIIACVAIAVATAFSLSACTDKNAGAIRVYAPDGAPALALAYAMSVDDKEYFGTDVGFEVVNASTIQTYVTGKSPKADICVLPVNAACNLLGTGENYKMLGAVTHGNLFLLKKAGGEDITADNLSALVGKTVGVVNLANVPGWTFKVILSRKEVAFKELGNDSTPDSDKVNLKALSDATAVTPAADCDYFVVPEPAATTKSGATTLEIAGSLQTLYGEGGYPQAVVVAKNSLINGNSEFIEKFIEALTYGGGWLTGGVSMSDIVKTINDNLTDGMTPSLNANNLNAQVIANCAISFEASASCKTAVLDYITAIKGVGATAKEPAEAFFLT